MKMTKTLVAAAVLAASPTLVAAYECSMGKMKEQTASMSCVEGTAWDKEAGACVATTT